jgi:3-oxoadipate enol-lactonase
MRSSDKNIKTTIQNLTISYDDQGPLKAPAIVFIHGFPFNKSMWDGQVEVLKDRFRTIAYDIRGHGGADPGHGNFSIDLFVHDLLCLLDHLKLEKVVVCGLSMGGYIALNAIQHHPDRFEGLVLADTQCIADTSEVRQKRIMAMHQILEEGVNAYADASLKNLFAADSLVSKWEEVGAIREMIHNTPIEVLCNTLQALANRKETCTRLGDISVPTLIFVGQEDKITPVTAAQYLHANIPGSILSIIPHAGHLPNLENASAFNRALQDFMQRFASPKIVQHH